MLRIRFAALAFSLASGLLLCAASAGAEDDLRSRVDALESELALLRRQLEVKEEQDAARVQETAYVTANADGFSLRSSDRKTFQLRLRGYVQADGRFFEEGGATNIDSFLLRRVRPIVEGTAFESVDFRIMPDFGQGTASLYDAYVNFRYWPEAQFQVGKFKPPLGLERLQSATNLMFVERGFPTLLVPARDVGAMLAGDLFDGRFRYEVGAFNGTRDNGNTENLDQDVDDGQDVVARAFAHPFQSSTIEALQGLGIGFAASYGDEDQTPPSFRTTGAMTRFFTYRSDVLAKGQRLRLSPQGYWYWGPFGALAEYVSSRNELLATTTGEKERATNDAWQVAASWVLTGENASYKGVIPRRPFRPDGSGFGAFEVAARYGEIEFDQDLFPIFADPASSSESAHQITGGVNWYLNRWLKVVLNYERTEFVGGDGSDDRETESLFMTRFQISY